MRPDLLLRLLAEETGERLFAMDVERAAAWSAREPSAAPEAPTSIAVVPLQGILTANGVRYMGRQLAPGMNSFRDAIDAAANDTKVGAIVIPTDSPGGTVAGTPETAAAVKAAAAVKPVVAFVDGINASAAYWITSQASQIWMTQSAEAGSIGVMATHVDLSGMLDQAGIRPTIVRSKSAPLKNELNPFEPLTEEAQARLQGRADELEDDFIATIAAGRKLTPDAVRASFGQGQMLPAQKALAAGMVDKIGGLPDLLGSLRTKSGAVRRRYSAVLFG